MDDSELIKIERELQKEIDDYAAMSRYSFSSHFAPSQMNESPTAFARSLNPNIIHTPDTATHSRVMESYIIDQRLADLLNGDSYLLVRV